MKKITSLKLKVDKISFAKYLVKRTKRPSTDRMKIFANLISDNGLVLRIYKIFKKLNNTKINSPSKNNGQSVWKDIYPKIYKNGKWTYEKLVNIYHYGIANKKHNVVPLLEWL